MHLYIDTVGSSRLADRMDLPALMYSTGGIPVNAQMHKYAHQH